MMMSNTNIDILKDIWVDVRRPGSSQLIHVRLCKYNLQVIIKSYSYNFSRGVPAFMGDNFCKAEKKTDLSPCFIPIRCKNGTERTGKKRNSK